jgi:hypothetical protein
MRAGLLRPKAANNLNFFKEKIMQEIIIDGVNLNEMKVKHDALQAEMQQARNSIRQGAAKFIAEKIAEGKKIVDELLEEENDKEKVEDLASKAFDLLSAASFVSDVAGVAFDLPYYDRQSDYYPDGTPYSNRFDDNENGLIEYDNPAISKLWGLLESMESEVQDWNTSYC